MLITGNTDRGECSCQYGGKKIFARESNDYNEAFCIHCIVNRVYPRLSGNDIEAAQPVLPKTKRTVGIEVEGNWLPEDAIRLWMNPLNAIKGDGSLRGMDAIEVVSPILTPAMAERWYLDLHLERCRTYNRTGEHWWFGTKDIDEIGINRLLCYCVMHQSEFMRLVPKSRTPAPSFDHSGRPLEIKWNPVVYNSKNGFIRSLYGAYPCDLLVDDGDKKIPKYQSSKRANDKDVYYEGPINRAWWLNVHSYFFTEGNAIEVRLKHTSINPVHGLFWMNMWLTILDQVPNMSYEDIASTSLPELYPPVLMMYREKPQYSGCYTPVTKDEVTLRRLWVESETYLHYM